MSTPTSLKQLDAKHEAERKQLAEKIAKERDQEEIKAKAEADELKRKAVTDATAALLALDVDHKLKAGDEGIINVVTDGKTFSLTVGEKRGRDGIWYEMCQHKSENRGFSSRSACHKNPKKSYKRISYLVYEYNIKHAAQTKQNALVADAIVIMQARYPNCIVSASTDGLRVASKAEPSFALFDVTAENVKISSHYLTIPSDRSDAVADALFGAG